MFGGQRFTQQLFRSVLAALIAVVPAMVLAKYNPAVTISSAQNPSPQGVGIFLYATITPAALTDARPTGTVDFYDGGTLICSAAALLNASSNAAFARCTLPTSTPVGMRTILAIYPGDVNYKATPSDAFSQSVSPAYTATATAGIGGTVTPSQYLNVLRGNSVFFDFLPATGYRFVRADVSSTLGCGNGIVTQQPNGAHRYVSGGLQGNCAVTGVFSNQLTVSFSAGTGGRISPAQATSLADGSRVTVTVTPDFGYRTTNVTGCGVVFSGSTMMTSPTQWQTAPLTTDCTVEAYFTLSPTVLVTASAGPNGRISPTSTAAPVGWSSQFAVTPDTGFGVASVTGCGGTLTGATYATAIVTTACAVTATFTQTTVAPTVTRLIEFHHPGLDYYFMTSRNNEIALLDATPPFVRTGESISVHSSLGTPASGTHGITRYFFDKIAVNQTRGSHFYTLVDGEISALAALNPSNAQLPRVPFSEGIDSFAYPPLVEGVGGSCATGRTPVYRVFRGNNKFPDNPNHRFTTKLSIYNDFVAKGWDGEGVKFCAVE